MHFNVHHVVNSLDPAGGGVPMVAVQVAAAQACLGASVSIHSLDTRGAEATGRYDLATILSDLQGMQEVRVHRHDSLKSLRTQLSHGGEHAKIFHLHGVWDLPLLTASRVARKVGRSYAVTPHGMLDPWSLKQSQWKKRAALAFGYRSMLNRAAFIQALNEDEKELMSPLGLRSPVEVVPNGVHLPCLNQDQASANVGEIDPRLSAGPYFLFLARLHYKKGLDVLLDAYARLRAGAGIWPLVIAGPDEGMGHEIKQRVKAGGFPGPVILPGPVYGKAKEALLKQAGVVVLPSRQEGFSLTILEAMAASVPVIVSDQCHFPEIASHEAGYVLPVDAQEVSQVMSLLSTAEFLSRRLSMGRRGFDLVGGRYTWPVVASRLLHLYAKQLPAECNAASCSD